MASTAEKPVQNLVSLVKKIRKILPGTVEKKSPTLYLVEGMVIVEFNYYCIWREQKPGETRDEAEARVQKECHPHSITIKFESEYIYKLIGRRPVPTSVYRTRTINKRKDGDFSVESVATAVTKCIEAVRSYLNKAKASDKHHKEVEQSQLAELNELAKLLPSINVDKQGRGFYIKPTENLRVSCNVQSPDDEEEEDLNKPPTFNYYISLDGITREQVVKVLEAIGVNK